MKFNEKPSLKTLLHYGMPRRSGRYPWGSGDNPYQHEGDFLSRQRELKAQGMTETEIAAAMGLSTTQYRAQKSLARDEERAYNAATAKSLRDKGYTLREIADQMGYANDSSVRALLAEKSNSGTEKSAQDTADFLKKQIEEKGMLDVGKGVERELNISRYKLDKALTLLEEEGYPVYSGGIPQVTNPGKQTTVKVLCPPGTEHKEIYNYGDIHSITDYISSDGGHTYKKGFVYPESMDSSRLKIRYGEEGGLAKDGVIEIRRGVPDLSLGNSHYAQVRILVDGTHYLKGLAVYSDDMPDGVDVVFNTNKKKGTPKESVLKEITKDPDNPFGSLIKEHGGQSTYTDKDGNEKLSLINKRAEEGDWGKWADKLPSQFLSKQNLSLVQKQLDLAVADKKAEYDDICSLTNPTIKRKMLQTFADDCDNTAVTLQAAALPRQKYQVILPITDMKDTEVYAPNYRDGEKVALVRYPHGGTFEIPILTVNNKQDTAKKVIGNDALDTIGINRNVAARLSGADFDGDTVMVIPVNSRAKITSTPPLKGLEGFDPTDSYGPDTYKGKTVRLMSKENVQKEMGVVSNLITDMTMKGANEEELTRAVKHSMVVIDAYKHELNYKQSEIDNGIASLKKKYQGHLDEEGDYHEGAATLISRASAEKSVTKRRGSPIIDPETGKVSYKEVHEEYVDPKTGKTTVRTQKSTQMAETDDARTLSSGTLVEEAYADYANTMKSLANSARKEMVSTGRLKYDPSANIVYRKEADSLKAQLNICLKNAPRERQAQAMANTIVAAKKQDNPGMAKKDLKKARQQAIVQSRIAVGAQRSTIKVSDKEWEAIQAGAISDNTLTQILDHVDLDSLRERATPRQTSGNTISDAKQNKIKSMQASGYTISEIADNLGIARSTVQKYLS